MVVCINSRTGRCSKYGVECQHLARPKVRAAIGSAPRQHSEERHFYFFPSFPRETHMSRTVLSRVQTPCFVIVTARSHASVSTSVSSSVSVFIASSLSFSVSCAPVSLFPGPEEPCVRVVPSELNPNPRTSHYVLHLSLRQMMFVTACSRARSAEDYG